MKLLSSAVLALSLFSTPSVFAHGHEHKDGKTCNCAEGKKEGHKCTCGEKCDGSCKHDKKEAHKCTGADCKHESHKEKKS